MSASHGTLPAIAAGTADRSPTVPVGLKTPREKLAPLKIAACIRRAQEPSASNPAAAKCVEGRGDALFVLAALVWCGR